MKPLLVGQAPGPRTDPARPFSGRSGARIAAVAGARRVADAFDVANLIGRWPGSAGKGDRFPMREARLAAARLNLDGRPLVVLAGLGVARAFGVPRPEFLRPVEVRGVPAVVVPHPSGVNRWWNDPRNRRRAARALRRMLRAAT